MIFPEYIKPGDTIAVTALSRCMEQETERTRFMSAKAQLEALGYKVIFTDNVFGQNDRFGRSSSAQEKACQFNALVADPSVKAIYSASGGDFLAEMLPYVDIELFKKNPKWLQGFSDNTSIIYYLATKGGVATAYGANFGDYGMVPWDGSVQANLGILDGSVKIQKSFETYQDGFGARETGLEGYAADGKVCWKNICYGKQDGMADMNDMCDVAKCGVTSKGLCDKTQCSDISKDLCDKAWCSDISKGLCDKTQCADISNDLCDKTQCADILNASGQCTNNQNECGIDKIVMEGYIIGGCMDVLMNIAGTPYDGTLDFIREHKDEGIIWFLESFDLQFEAMMESLWKMKEMGWFEGCKGIVFGRPLFYRNEGFDGSPLPTYEDVLHERLDELNVPVIMDADIGHKGPQFVMIEGARARIESAGGQGSCTYLV